MEPAFVLANMYADITSLPDLHDTLYEAPPEIGRVAFECMLWAGGGGMILDFSMRGDGSYFFHGAYVGVLARLGIEWIAGIRERYISSRNT